jgi:hypothetical protein
MITPAHNLQSLKEAFYRVFNTHNPFDPAVRGDVPIRIILFMTDSYHLEAEQFFALTETLKVIGEDEFYISEVEEVADPFDSQNKWRRDHWVCVNPTFEEYTKLPIGIENALYSPKGGWGILLSHESHGLLGCHQYFWDVFQTLYPDWRSNLKEFIKWWETSEAKDSVKYKWLGPLLAHLNPSDNLIDLLRK